MITIKAFRSCRKRDQFTIISSLMIQSMTSNNQVGRYKEVVGVTGRKRRDSITLLLPMRMRSSTAKEEIKVSVSMHNKVEL